MTYDVSLMTYEVSPRNYELSVMNYEWSHEILWDPMGPWARDPARPTRENDDENDNDENENDENGNTVTPHSTRAQGWNKPFGLSPHSDHIYWSVSDCGFFGDPDSKFIVLE